VEPLKYVVMPTLFSANMKTRDSKRTKPGVKLFVCRQSQETTYIEYNSNGSIYKWSCDDDGGLGSSPDVNCHLDKT